MHHQYTTKRGRENGGNLQRDGVNFNLQQPPPMAYHLGLPWREAQRANVFGSRPSLLRAAVLAIGFFGSGEVSLRPAKSLILYSFIQRNGLITNWIDSGPLLPSGARELHHGVRQSGLRRD